MANKMQDLKNRIVKLFFDKIETVTCIRDINSLQRLYDNINCYQNLTDAATDDYVCISDFLARSLESESLSPKESTLIAVFAYLLLAEGHICNDLNYISYLLVTTGHDLYSLRMRKYVKDNVDEIRKVEMSTKIQFLNYHGFGVLTKEYDSTFRNDIAHHNYKVDDKGVLWIRGKSVKLDSKIDSLNKITKLVIESIREINRRFPDIFNKMGIDIPKT